MLSPFKQRVKIGVINITYATTAGCILLLELRSQMVMQKVINLYSKALPDLLTGVAV